MPFHRQVLIDLAPPYLRYMDGTANRVTVPAQPTGFYTVEIRSLGTGNVQSKTDPLVMENLFYAQTVARTFDLKGIQDRRVKAAATGGPSPKTLFDGEWVEGMLFSRECSSCSHSVVGQQQALTLVRPHSKVVIQEEALWSEADFLVKSNVMDYS
jgi:1-phosphatidylinositol-3-phosphate 5-kinase